MLRAVFWRLVRRLTALAEQRCRNCGRRCEAFTTDDETWQRATGGADPLCFACFDQRARARGLNPVWRVTLGNGRT